LNDQKKQRKYYSGKKKRHTIKSQVIVDRATSKIICTCVNKGRRHDFRVYKESKTHLLPSAVMQADSGYQGINKVHAKSEIPLKSTKKTPLSKQQKKENHRLSSSRVLVENVIRSLKIFRILAERYRNRRKKFGLRLNLIAAICNCHLNI
jgi:uncharacterized protein (DUF2344 family)